MRRRAYSAVVLGSLVLAGLTGASRAEASGAWLGSGALQPIEQRVAVAVSPQRTTLWTSLRFDADAGLLGVVIPVPPGAALDTSSDAWFEALELATAPRVFPPSAITWTCSGSTEPGDPFHVVGATYHEPGLLAKSVTVLEDLEAVSTWADTLGLVLPQETSEQLGQMPGMRFVVARFASEGGPAVTQTLRVVMPPGSDAVLPLSLTRAADTPVVVTTWLIGQGRGSLWGSEPITLPSSSLIWDAKTSESNYAEARSEMLLSVGPWASLLESTSHEALSSNAPVAEGAASIPGVITTFFERAFAYGDGDKDTQGCISKAAAALSSGAEVGASCPRADLGVVDGTDTCAEGPVGSATDPESLRCGAGADDLAVGLSGQVPASAWLTRQSMVIAAGQSGTLWTVDFGAGASTQPVFEAASVDVSQCDGGSSSSGTGGPIFGDTSSSSGGSPGNGPPGGGYNGSDVYGDSDVGCGCSGTQDTVGWDDSSGSGDTYSEDDETYYEDDTTSDGCSSDTTDTYSDETYSDDSSEDCSSDTTDTYSDETYSDDSSEDCSSDTTDTYSDDSYYDDSYSDDSSEDCSSDTTDTSSDDSSDDCSSDTSGTSSGDSYYDSDDDSGYNYDGSGSSGAQCSISSNAQRGAKKRGPKLSVMTLGMLAFLAPFRRLGTRRRQRGKA